MRRAIVIALASALAVPAAGLAGSITASADDAIEPGPGHHGELGRQVLPANDGWASADGGTTGGAGAAGEDVYRVTDHAELTEALRAAQDRPSIIEVEGIIDGDIDAEGNQLTCQDHADPGYTLDAYLQAYDPETWGDADPSGPLEEARARSATNQAAHLRLDVPADTTIVGVGDDAEIRGTSLRVSGVDNVIIRNIEFEAPVDCFPQWDPTDGELGAWNSEYDAISLVEATHVWIDHNTFHDGRFPDSELPDYYGVPYQVHDGLADITNGSDLVTVSWNVFRDHDKTMLIGSSNTRFTDRGKLRVTLHHNLFDGILQRAPRVRFGQVHIYNNHYVIREGEGYLYSYGVGVESAIRSDRNFFRMSGVPAGDVIYNWGGTTVHSTGDMVADDRGRRRVDLRAAHNDAHGGELSDAVGWNPTRHTRIWPAVAVPALVNAKAGSGQLR
ncbi:pectate lyase family protein [Actinoalloteichus hymeniacidonis]|uniref:Pectate lyase n=1 Tax=Actinoalloteichus hymeniacidonis TaxID=340345 RepID=A0AAC9HT93_9PSEU|nr:polysaccharide lyase family 1 protein [Actinoalloteichus hymeniacidonis]AOS64929.1 pectate lyase [Actinoalloteichus hymeniacidonis]MBB5906996.1 pectate lyase [Actinoalloteichus hymeniacidonis]